MIYCGLIIVAGVIVLEVYDYIQYGMLFLLCDNMRTLYVEGCLNHHTIDCVNKR